MSTVREIVGGLTLRLYAERRDAITVAKNRTWNSGMQHHQEVRVHNGYVIRNVVTGDVYDDGGLIPPDVVKLLEEQENG